jgi:hypothetical protein
MRAALAVVAIALGAPFGAANAQQPAPPRTPPRTLHPVAGRTECLSCHAPGANQHIKSTPAAHRFGNAACAMCHRPIEATPANLPHPPGDAFRDCLVCHVPDSPAGAPLPPAWHESFHPSICGICHQAAAPSPPGGPLG